MFWLTHHTTTYTNEGVRGDLVRLSVCFCADPDEAAAMLELFMTPAKLQAMAVLAAQLDRYPLSARQLTDYAELLVTLGRLSGET